MAQVGVGDGPAVGVQALDRRADGPVRRAPAEDEQVAARRAEDLERRDVVGDARDLGLAQELHGVVVVRVVADVARDVGLLQAADAVLEALGAGHGPRPGERVRVAQVGPEGRRVAGVGDRDVGQVGDVRDAPRLGAGGQEGVGQEHDRGHVLEGQPPGLDGHREAVARGRRRDDGSGESLLRPNMTWSRSACSFLVGMPVDGPARWTSTTTRGSSTMTARPMASDLRAMPGPELAVRPMRPAVARPDGRPDGRDLVLRLEGLDPERLVARQLVEDVAGRGDRVRAVEQGPVGQLAGGQEARGPWPRCR